MSPPVLITLISALVILGPMANNIVVPSLPAIASGLRVSFGDAQLVLSVYMIGFAAGQLVVGPMSDRFGRKPVLTISLVIYSVASIGAALAPDLASLVATRLVQAVGVSATMSVGRAMVRDCFTSEKIAQVYAYVGTVLAIGPIVGPIFGGVIQVAAGWRAVFGVIAALGVAMLLVVIFKLRETNPHLNPDATRMRGMVGNYATLLANRGYMGYVLCNTLCYGGIFAYTSCSSYILIDLLGISPDTFGVLYAVTVGAYGVGALFASQITRRVALNDMILLGGLLMTISGFVLVILPMLGYFSVWTVVVPFAGFTFGTGFVFPSGQAGAVTPFPKMAGAASSMLSCLQMSFAALTGSLAARLLDGTMMPMAWTVMIMGPALLVGFYVLVVKPSRRAESAAV